MMFVCHECGDEFEDDEGEAQANCDCIREEGECLDCAGYK